MPLCTAPSAINIKRLNLIEEALQGAAIPGR